jgi:hypothetical protein
VIITSSPTPIRLQRFFPNKTLLMVQIRSPFTLTIAHDQGEAQAAQNGQPDGCQLTQANTSPPFVFPWKGELWHIASVAASQWSLIIISEEEASVRVSDSDAQQSSQSRLDYSIKQRC